ncbi:MAG: DUF350 domain-containing protein [Deltaproteobacteria bacterium]|nr:MAG: DUF350 domain-containing protein [Deltaproteobacteria bacterium]
MSIIGLNIAYAVSGAILTLVFMYIGYRLFDRFTSFDTGKALEAGNIAVGITVGAIFISLGVAIGMVIGMGLN